MDIFSMEDGTEKETSCSQRLVSSVVQSMLQPMVQPMLKHVKPVRANYVPRKYKPFDEGGDCGDVSCAMSIDNVSGVVGEGTQADNSTSNAPHHAQNLDVDMSPVKSSQYPVKPATGGRPKDVQLLDSLSLEKKDIKGDHSQNPVNSCIALSLVHDKIDISRQTPVPPKRGRGRPKGSVKKQYRQYVTYTDGKTSPSRFTRSKSKILPLCCPSKKIKLMAMQDNQVVLEENKNQIVVEESSPTLDEKTSKATNSKHTTRSLQCNICNKIFSSQTRLQNHMHWHVQHKIFKCNTCKKVFKSFSCFIQHQQLHRTSSNEKVRKEFKCRVCSQTFESLRKLRIHLPIHHLDENGNRHRYKCNVCGKDFVFFGWLKQHARRCHNLTHLTKANTQICCPKLPAYKIQTRKLTKALIGEKVHQTSNGNNDSPHHACHSNVSFDNNVNDPKYTCRVCNKKFASRTLLMYHKNSHKGKKRFTCRICNKTMARHVKLVLHMRTAHKDVKPYKCDEFQSKYAGLLRHTKSQHKNSLPGIESEETDSADNNVHQCGWCDRTFKSLYWLQRHSASHRKQQSTKATLPSFTHKYESSRSDVDHIPPKLKKHLFSQQVSEPCKLENSKVIPHVNVNQGPKFTNHVEKPHLREDQPAVKPNENELKWITVWQENGKRVYACGLCPNRDRKFLLISSVRKHIGMLHREFTNTLVEPPGLYNDLQTGQLSAWASKDDEPVRTSSVLSSIKTQNCTCNGRGKAFVYKNNKLTHLPNDCPVHWKGSNECKTIPNSNPVLVRYHCDEELDSMSQEKFQECEPPHELGSIEPIGMTYACFECEKEFASANELMEHYDREH